MTPPDLSSMKKAELIALARKWKVQVDSKSLKKDLLKKLKRELKRRQSDPEGHSILRSSKSTGRVKKTIRPGSGSGASGKTSGTGVKSRSAKKPVMAKKAGPDKDSGGSQSIDKYSVKRTGKKKSRRGHADPAPGKKSGPSRKASRKPVFRAKIKERPPVRLEETPGGLEAKFLLAPPQTHDEGAVEHPAELPTAYGTTRLVLLPRDPYWIYAYWELTRQESEAARSRLNETWEALQWVLRIYYPDCDHPQAGSQYFDTQVDPFASGWTLHLWPAGASFQGEIGVRDSRGHFEPVARSNKITLPADRPSDCVDEEWISTEDEFRLIYGGLPGHRGPFPGVAGPSPLPAGGPFSSRFNPFKKR